MTKKSALQVLKESLKHKGFRLLILGFFVCGFQITLVATHVPRYVQDRGLEDWTGFAILSLVGLFNIIGVLIMGYLGDKYSKKKLLSGLYFLRAISIGLFIFFPPSEIICFSFWSNIWTCVVGYSSCNKWNCCSNFWYQKYINVIWNCFLNHQIGSFFLEHILVDYFMIFLVILIMHGTLQLYYHLLLLYICQLTKNPLTRSINANA